jgi:hypothetical protein
MTLPAVEAEVAIFEIEIQFDRAGDLEASQQSVDELEIPKSFLNTLEGGVVPAIRRVNAREHNRQSVVLKKFYNGALPTASTPWPGCNLTAQLATDVVPLASSTFLNIAFPPGVAIGSQGICNALPIP